MKSAEDWSGTIKITITFGTTLVYCLLQWKLKMKLTFHSIFLYLFRLARILQKLFNIHSFHNYILTKVRHIQEIPNLSLQNDFMSPAILQWESTSFKLMHCPIQCVTIVSYSCIWKSEIWISENYCAWIFWIHYVKVNIMKYSTKFIVKTDIYQVKYTGIIQRIILPRNSVYKYVSQEIYPIKISHSTV